MISLEKRPLYACFKWFFTNYFLMGQQCEVGEFDAGEFDIVLVNGKNVAIIEVKNRIKQRFVKDLVEVKVDRFRKFMPEYSDKKLYLGIAGFSFSSAVVEKAKQYGIGIIRQVGQSIEMETKNLKAY